MGSSTQNQTIPPISIIIPAYNEERAITETIQQIHRVMNRAKAEFEIVVVDDGSSDNTLELLNNMDVSSLKIVRHIHNKGYGAALKTGIRAADHQTVAITDADGTYPNERLPELAAQLGNLDMLVGARTGKNVRIPLIRRPAKWFIGKLANFLARYKIPDLNSGLRVFKRKTLKRYLSILPDGFSFTTTITLAMLTQGDRVAYTEIDYAKRVGKSKIRPIRDTLNFVQLIIRTILLFKPLRIFLPISTILFLSAAGVLYYSAFHLERILDSTVTLLFIGGLQILAVGMIADMINRRLS